MYKYFVFYMIGDEKGISEQGNTQVTTRKKITDISEVRQIEEQIKYDNAKSGEIVQIKNFQFLGEG